MARFKLKDLYPTRSGIALLLALGLIIGGLSYWIFWILRTVPEGSEVSAEVSAEVRIKGDSASPTTLESAR